MQTSSVKSAYYNTAADQAVMTGDNQSGCVMVTTVDISPASTGSR